LQLRLAKRIVIAKFNDDNEALEGFEKAAEPSERRLLFEGGDRFLIGGADLSESLRRENSDWVVAIESEFEPWKVKVDR
jgi:hypothetical protein